MTQENVQLVIPFQALVDCIAGLNLDDKRRLWELLNEEIVQVEERLWEQDPEIQTEIREARAAYQTGDYVTIDEYIDQQQENS